MRLISLLILISITVTVVSAGAPPPTAVECSELVISMVDCLSYVSENSTVTKPQGTCCSGLKTVMKQNPNCLCEAFKNSAQLGVSLNVTKALSLPSACHVSSPDLNSCHVNHGTVAPVMSPKSAMSPKADSGMPTTTAGSTKLAPAPSPKKNSAAGLTTSIGSFLAIAVALTSFT